MRLCVNFTPDSRFVQYVLLTHYTYSLRCKILTYTALAPVLHDTIYDDEAGPRVL